MPTSLRKVATGSPLGSWRSRWPAKMSSTAKRFFICAPQCISIACCTCTALARARRVVSGMTRMVGSVSLTSVRMPLSSASPSMSSA